MPPASNYQRRLTDRPQPKRERAYGQCDDRRQREEIAQAESAGRPDKVRNQQCDQRDKPMRYVYDCVVTNPMPAEA